MTNQKIAVIILAAGKSSRIDKIKQLLPWKSKTLIENIIDIALSTNSFEIFVVLGSSYNKISKIICDYKIKLIYNKLWQKGIGESLSLAIKKIIKHPINFDGALIILGDQPLISSEYLNKMIEDFYKNRKYIIATKYKKSFGVPAIFGNIFFKKLTRLNKDFGAKKIMSDNKKFLKLIKVNHSELNDIDTLKDYQNLKY